MNLTQWQLKHGVSGPALTDLIALLTAPADITPDTTEDAEKSEAYAQQAIRLEAPKHGVRLYRNNAGAGSDDNGNFFRWGLGNDTAAMNKKIKFPDLIGITPVLVTTQHVGQRLGVFTGVEVKAPGWRYMATEREVAQLAAHQLILSMGGLACFATKPGDVWTA